MAKKFETSIANMQINFAKCGVNIVKVRMNGNEIATHMWEPYYTDVSEWISVNGENELELTLVNNLRNMQGPFHLQSGESYFVTPADFYKEKCVWCNECDEGRWNDNYCLACVSIESVL